MSTEIVERFALFAGKDGGIESWLTSATDQRIFDRLATVDMEPLGRPQLNQLLLLGHEAAVSDGYFKYYWLHTPEAHFHPYRVEALEGYSTDYKDRKAIHSIEHLRWGLYRLYVDALLFFGNVRQAYRKLRGLSFDQISNLYRLKCFDYQSSAGLVNRGPALPLNEIPKDDRYLISETACKSFDPAPAGSKSMIDALEVAYKTLTKASKKKRFSIKELIGGIAESERQYELTFSANEFIDESVGSMPELRKKYRSYKTRFDAARASALGNTEMYLSSVNDLDVYVATSMRTRDDFRQMAERCVTIFEHDALSTLMLRHYDPTLSAAPGHEDKGLIECLMVKCAKVLIYMAGEKESYGKDAEAAMALSLGKPVIFLCDEEQRSRFYKDVHPLSRLIDFKTGVAVGAFVTSRIDHVPLLLHRILSNSMEYEILRPKDNYLQLRDKLTKSIVRLQTNNLLLRETFWNHYHNPV
jgi:hypothetical protein